MPSMPSDNACLPGKPPRPRSVIVTGIFVSSESSFNSADAFDMITPPPAYITGFFALAIKWAAFFICHLFP